MKSWIKVTLLAGGLASASLVGYGAGKMGAHAQGGPGMGPGPGMMGEGGQRGPGMGQGMGPGMGMGQGMGRGEGGGQGMMGSRGHGHHQGGEMRGRMGGPFAQFFINRDNKNLTNDDVKKIAEAGLLWFGERNWRIGEVKDSGSRTAEFALVTTEGGVIARFTMDRDTGRVRRIA